MEIGDEVYGRVQVHDPLLLDLLSSTAVQRLKHLYMGGITALLSLSPKATRHDHSVGAMLLVRRLGGSVEEQAAALLHDVSHTGLGHVVDYVFDTPSRQAFHDDHKEAYLRASAVPDICADHGVDWRHLADERSWPLVEQKAPRLCADRIDYTWRDVEALGVMTTAGARSVTEALRVHDDRIVFDAPAPARRFAEAYLACDELCWSAPAQVGVYALAAEALGAAVAANTISRDDLWLTDEALWRRICEAGGPLAERVEAVAGRLASFVLDPSGDVRIRPKVRYVDPDVVV